jgi:GT2 family glycosyltransferase
MVLVLSGGAAPPDQLDRCRLVRSTPRLGFAAAVNRGLNDLGYEIESVAVLNDDALPGPEWLARLVGVLEERKNVAAVQGTVLTADGTRVDGRGIELDRWGLPVQTDRDEPFSDDHGERPLIAVSATACVLRMQALRQIALTNRQFFDEAFDSYHEDLDLGLRLRRTGWHAVWTGGAAARHLGSASGGAFGWRHPWWLLANRWRVLAGNFTPGTLVRAAPRLLRGEVRAANTLARSNPRALPAAAATLVSLPWLMLRGWLRSSAGPRLDALPENPS